MKTIPLPRWLTARDALTLNPAARPAGIPGGKTSSLAKNTLFRLGRRAGVRAIAVERGTVWLTAAPEDGDILLQAGQSLPLRAGQAVLLQALTDATIRLIPSPAP
ncbi:MAG: DUF2917 domain-containing protein [Verrucomicrobiota bacterium]